MFEKSSAQIKNKTIRLHKYDMAGAEQKEEIKQPKAQKLPDNKIQAIYPHNIFKLSASKHTFRYIHSGVLNKSIHRHMNHADINLPTTTDVSETGCVNKNSSVPVFLSSAHKRMVIAGIKNAMIYG